MAARYSDTEPLLERIETIQIENDKLRFSSEIAELPRQVLVKTCGRLQCIHSTLPVSSPLVPIVTARSGDGRNDIFSVLLGERIICLMEPITDSTSSIVVAQLLFLESQDNKKPINMYINSPGGSLTAGLGIYDAMQHIRSPISTWCVGQACSMASLLLAAGNQGMRHALPNSRIMIHQIMGSYQGQATDIQLQAEEILRLKRSLNNLYVTHTKKPLSVIEDSMERDKFMSPHEAQEFGIIDEVIEPGAK